MGNFTLVSVGYIPGNFTETVTNLERAEPGLKNWLGLMVAHLDAIDTKLSNTFSLALKSIQSIFELILLLTLPYFILGVILVYIRGMRTCTHPSALQQCSISMPAVNITFTCPPFLNQPITQGLAWSGNLLYIIQRYQKPVQFPRHTTRQRRRRLRSWYRHRARGLWILPRPAVAMGAH